MQRPIGPSPFALLLAGDAGAPGLRLAQNMVVDGHYLHAPVDERCSPVAYIVEHSAIGFVGCLIFGRPEATRCYSDGLTYGSIADVAAGRAEWDRWELLNLARVYLNPTLQPGGRMHTPEAGLPGYYDRLGIWRSTLASWLIRAALERIGYDYLRLRPPVDCAEPWELRRVLSYCDTRLHQGTIYRAAGWRLARTNSDGIQTWVSPPLPALSADQDAEIRRLAERSPRSQRIRRERTVAGARQGELLL